MKHHTGNAIRTEMALLFLLGCSICMAMATFIVNANAAPAQTMNQLIQVDYSRPDGAVSQSLFHYGNDGRLAVFTNQLQSDTGNRSLTLRFFYDDLGNLERYQKGENINPEVTYQYDAAGLLTGWSVWEYDFEELHYSREYDENGRLIRETGENGNITVFSYDQNGQLVSSSSKKYHGDMVGTIECVYSYDSDGQLVEKTVTSDWGFGELSIETFQYRYDCTPFVVITEYNKGQPVNVDIEYTEPTSGHVFSFPAGQSPKFELQDGYLTRIRSDVAAYEFTYGSNLAF